MPQGSGRGRMDRTRLFGAAMIKPSDIQAIRQTDEVNPLAIKIIVRLRLEGSNVARPMEEQKIENDLKAECWEYLYGDISRKLDLLRLKMSAFSGHGPFTMQVNALADELEKMLTNPFDLPIAGERR